MTVSIENIRTFASAIRDATGAGSTLQLLSMDLARVLNWSEGGAYIQPAHVNVVSAHITKGLVGSQPAAVFAVESATVNGDLLNNAALYAYHASISWGLLATAEGAMVFNSHWIRRNNWFHLPFIHWNEIQQNVDVFNAITPEGIKTGQIDRIAATYYQPDKFLLPVDDALVERLDYWRSETLRFSRDTQNVDEKLQTFFAQIFILRTVEDRKMADNLPSLRSLSSLSGEINLAGLKSLFRSAQDTIGSELFEVDVLDTLPENVLGGIINDLYTPHDLPYQSARYNFAWIKADVLAVAYEKYLSTILSPVVPTAQSGLFDQPLRDVARVAVRKSAGVSHTPNYLVQFLTEKTLEHFGSIDQHNLPQVVDFACGSGSFLVAAADSLIRYLRDVDNQRNWARDLVNGKYIFGVDIDKRAVMMARLALWLRFAEEPHPLPLPGLEDVILHGDALSDEVWSNLPESFDIILGNPPYLATGRTPDREYLAAKFRTAQGRYDYSYLFIETALKHLRTGGVLGFIVPNRLFRNRDAGIIRDILTTDARLLDVVDFGSNEVFDGTRAYIGVITAQKVEQDQNISQEYIHVTHVQDVSSRFLSSILLDSTRVEEDVHNEILVSYKALHPRGNNPWVLVSPSARRTRSLLEENSEPLSSIAGIYQGIRTGANDVFIVAIESSDDGTLARVINGLGDSGLVETELLYPVVFGSDIQRYERISTNRHILYPYRSNTAIPESELHQFYPRTYEYLMRYRDVLSLRSSIGSSGLRWYELIQKRDETWLSSPKLLIRDLAIHTSFAIDEMGTTFLVGGTAVVPADLELLHALLAYLNSKLVNQYLSQITPLFHSGLQKFEPQHLQRIPVLRRLCEPGDVSDELSNLAIQLISAKNLGSKSEVLKLQEVIDKMIFQAAGLSEQGLL